MHRARHLVTWLAIGLAGCVVGPDYRRPAVDVPSAWRVSTEEAAQITDLAWWDRFGDPVLSRLVRTALENNKDLAIASANVDQFFAQYGITRSALFPEVDSGASAQRQHLSENTAPFTVPPADKRSTTTASISRPATSWIFGASCGARPRRRGPACSPVKRAAAPWC